MLEPNWHSSFRSPHPNQYADAINAVCTEIQRISRCQSEANIHFRILSRIFSLPGVSGCTAHCVFWGSCIRRQFYQSGNVAMAVFSLVIDANFGIAGFPERKSQEILVIAGFPERKKSKNIAIPCIYLSFKCDISK